ncbi:MAG: O-methyltransferase [Actinomycetota bacterium]|jgi:O-methyltransferase|nr:O-methyltransferase [Actinomycetota bacterium]
MGDPLVTQARPAAPASPTDLYLDLLKGCLSRDLFPERYRPVGRGASRAARVYGPVRRLLGARALELVRRIDVDPAGRREGKDQPEEAETMMGRRRLDNLHHCITDVLENDVPGDLIETGVWRGGGTIFMRGVLAAYGDSSRRVWVADSFSGLPRPNEAAFPADSGDEHWKRDWLAVSQADVQANFARYGLLDDQVRFLPGFFSDTLPTAPIERLAVLRLDGDLYESTIVALRALYPKLSPGGYVIVDDYGAIRNCRAAVDDYRREHGIEVPMQPIDWTGYFWQRPPT